MPQLTNPSPAPPTQVELLTVEMTTTMAEMQLQNDTSIEKLSKPLRRLPNL